LSLEIPRTITGSLQDIHDASTDYTFPAIIKETTSSGATSLVFVQNYEDLILIMDNLKMEDSEYVLQEYVDGTDASVSLMVTESESKVITVNKQYIHKGVYGQPSKYLGGECPLDHPANEAAKLAATQIVEAIPGLKGYVGIDFILQGKNALPMEINPRLTVSSIGIARVIGPEALAGIINEKVVQTSKQYEYHGYTVFREYTGLQSQISNSHFRNIPGVMSPPVYFEQLELVVPPYLCGWGASIIEAKKDLSIIQEKIETLLEGGI
jgi:predicted ATP-grasp superfamily ATP-dependent carboligase